MDQDPVVVSQSYWEAEMQRDLDLIVSHFSTDAVFYTPERTWTGIDEIRERYSRMIEEFPILTLTTGWVLSEGERAAIEWHASLTDTLGRSTLLAGVNLVHVAGGKFRSIRCYFGPSVGAQ